MVFQLCHDGFQAFFEIASIAGASKQGAHIERENRCICKNLGRFTRDNLACQSFGDGCFTNAGIADQKRVVFTTAAQHLNAAFNLGVATDQGINIAFTRFGVQIDAVFLQRGFFFIAIGDALGFFLMLWRTGDRTRFAECRVFSDTVRDEVNRVVTGHVLFLQEIGRVAFAFREDRDQHICTGDFSPARGLHMDRSALDDPLKGSRWYGFGAIDIGDKVAEVFVDEFDQGIAQFRHVDRAGFHHLNRVGFIDQGQQQMFKRCEFMTPRIGQRQGGMNCLF